MNNRQNQQVVHQLKVHRHKKYKIDIKLAEDYVLRGFIVEPTVLRPEVMTALHLARYLFFNNGLYMGQRVIDMGCGSGIQGIVMALRGAEHVIFSDISSVAVKNTRENIKKLRLSARSTVLQGDLFKKVRGKAKVIVFNHPFFPARPEAENPFTRAILDPGELIHRFFKEARRHLETRATIVMPYFHLAGPVNDPSRQALKHGYKVTKKFSAIVKSGIQRGKISIFEITR